MFNTPVPLLPTVSDPVMSHFEPAWPTLTSPTPVSASPITPLVLSTRPESLMLRYPLSALPTMITSSTSHLAPTPSTNTWPTADVALTPPMTPANSVVTTPPVLMLSMPLPRWPTLSPNAPVTSHVPFSTFTTPVEFACLAMYAERFC